MNTSAEVADLMVKEGIQITESAAKLAGLGAKNLAAIIIALVNDDNKMQGLTNLKQLLKSGKPLCIMQIKEADIKKFSKEAKNYGVLCTAVKDKTKQTEYCDIIARQDDIPQLNHILEKMNYPAPAPEIEPEKEADNEQSTGKDGVSKQQSEKNSQSRARENQSENNSKQHGNIGDTGNLTNGKPSVKQKVEDIKAERAKTKDNKEPVRTPQHRPPAPKKKKKSAYKSKQK